jgi:hypothetical protein
MEDGEMYRLAEDVVWTEALSTVALPMQVAGTG